MLETMTGNPGIPQYLYENEDIESWLVEEGIGYFDAEGFFHYEGEEFRTLEPLSRNSTRTSQ